MMTPVLSGGFFADISWIVSTRLWLQVADVDEEFMFERLHPTNSLQSVQHHTETICVCLFLALTICRSKLRHVFCPLWSTTTNQFEEIFFLSSCHASFHGKFES